MMTVDIEACINNNGEIICCSLFKGEYSYFLANYFGLYEFKEPFIKCININIEQTNDLLNKCNEIIENPNKANELLPSNRLVGRETVLYNKRYYDTIENLRTCLKEYIIPQFNEMNYFKHYYPEKEPVIRAKINYNVYVSRKVKKHDRR